MIIVSGKINDNEFFPTEKWTLYSALVIQLAVHSHHRLQLSVQSSVMCDDLGSQSATLAPPLGLE